MVVVVYYLKLSIAKAQVACLNFYKSNIVSSFEVNFLFLKMLDEKYFLIKNIFTNSFCLSCEAYQKALHFPSMVCDQQFNVRSKDAPFINFSQT